ncbi:hypothetical protein WICPIJ_010133 [Wickerhamomyces pijperi]|uniref:E3 ubiquitin-protein ligase listerin n=1 Tax=Wickerhamomyces pijperi TaxID=599730 RepID=A0A9P8TAZ3_WICPI|nr:hypothetical protein WICPIJ_010133 [Wickerhamomyces pijperi]
MSFGNPFASSTSLGHSSPGYNDNGVQSLGYNGFEVSLNYISGIPDPNIVGNSQLKLIFKSLMKRDELTKEKALTEFINFIKDEGNISNLKDDLVLITWIQLYPKLATSESKTVRAQAHQVQTMLILRLKKTIMKYLKDSVPVLFTGLFDMDSSVANSTNKNLLLCFNEDQSKVDNLWIMFQPQILNFVEQVLNVEKVETLSDDRVVVSDEALLKYLRLVNATISMFTQLLQICVKSEEKFQENIDKYQDVLLYENLWHYLLINSNPNNQRIYKTLIHAINVITAVKPDLLTKKSWKLISKRIFKAITFAKRVDPTLTNSLVYSSVIIPTLSTIINLGSINADFYSYDKDCSTKILDFLRVGSLSSNASYYQYLLAFVDKSGLELEPKALEEILYNDLELEISKNLKLRAGADFIVNSLVAYLQITKKLDVCSDDKVLHKCLSVKAPVTARFVEPLAEYLSDDCLLDKLESACLDTVTFLLKIAQKKKDLDLSEFLTSSLNKLRYLADEDETGASFSDCPTFTIFEFITTNQLTQYSEIVADFIDEIPGFITLHTIPQSISLLVAYSHYQSMQKELFLETFDNCLAKLIMLDSRDSLIQKLDSFQFKDQLLQHSEELRSVVSNISSTYDFKDDNLFKEHLINKDSLLAFYELGVAQGKFGTFLDFYWKYNSNNLELLRELVHSSDFLNSLLSSPRQEVLSRIHGLVSEDEEIKDKYLTALKESYESINDATLSQIKEHLHSNQPLAEELASEDLTLDLLEAYGDEIDSRLAIGNPLDVNIYLLPTKENVFPFEPLKRIITYAAFLVKLDLPLNDSSLVYLNIVKEIAIDYDFLQDSNNSEQIETYQDQFNVVAVKLLSRFADLPYTLLVEQIVNKTIEIPLLSELIDEEIEVVGFYKTRLLERILSNYEPRLTKELNFQPFVRSAMKEFGLSTLRVVTTLKGLDFSSVHYERLRNFVGSEIVGIRPSNIRSEGLAKLLLLNRFIEHADSDGELFPATRFNMIIGEMNKWIESDLSYESEFSHLRIVLIKTLTNFNLLNFTKTEKFMELTENLVTDSVGFIKMSSEDDTEDLIELKYFTLKLYLVLERQGVEVQVKDDLLEVFLAEKFQTANQPSKLYGDLLMRFIQTLPVRKFKPLYDDLVLKNSEITGNYDIKRGILDIVKSLILDRQQDLAVEFELNKEEDLTAFKIESSFIENVLNTPKLDHLQSEDESNYELIKYLWNWELLLLKFTDISLKLRGVYIQQLQSHDELIIKFLNFIAVLVSNVDKSSFANLEEYDIANYSFDNQFTLDEEIRILAVHLYYKLLVSIGSLSNNWFNDIKDRTFKAELETFTIKYISPKLIAAKLEDFESKSKKLVSEDDNLTIKVNRITNEVKAIYLIDEQTMEVVFKVPSNYPLTNIEVIGSQRIGVKEPQWKSWILSSQTIISFQNGSILESLQFFLKNVSYHFKGFEECAICYSILHSDNSLPSKNCQTCKNKFHSGCLYKWFKSSGGNSCPLCRSTFNFR